MPDPTPATLRHRLELLLYRLFTGLLALLPYRAALALGRGLGSLGSALSPRYRRMVRAHLEAADLGLDSSAIHRVQRDCFRHYGAMLMGMLHRGNWTRDQVLAQVDVHGLEHWDAALAEGRGLIAFSGHFGDWEAMVTGMGAHGRGFALIGRPLNNQLLDPVLTELRQRFGNTHIPKSGALRGCLQVLRAGQAVGFMLDQNALEQGVFVDFLGRPASTHASAALLAVKHDIPVLPMRSTPRPDGTVRVDLGPAIHLPTSGDLHRDAWIGTQLMTRHLEGWIREQPSWWFWMHRRHKTRPTEHQPLAPEAWRSAVPPLDPWTGRGAAGTAFAHSPSRAPSSGD